MLLRKIISILFLVLYLLTTTEVYQFAKMPLLFEHYHAHKMADKNLGLWGFVYEHYFNSSPNDPDYAADMQLPFKSHNECVACNLSSLRFVQQQIQIVIPLQPAELFEKEYSLYKRPPLLSTCLSNIWQPPKQA